MSDAPTTTDYSSTIAIVGAGAAGCVLANRILANTPNHVKVLLLERGPYQPHNSSVLNDLSRFPAGLNKHAVWNLSTSQAGLAQRQVWAHTATGMGGATALNAGVFFMGRKSNFENWPGKHFSAANFDRALEEVRQIHKPVVISEGLAAPNTPAGRVIAGMQEKMNLKETGKSLLWLEEDGFYKYNSSSVGNQGEDVRARRTVVDSFLPTELCTNSRLTILTNASVTKLLTADADNNMMKVTGLVYETSTTILGYKIRTVSTELKGFREVVLSSGAIASPQLLMASGIGPREELEKANIPIVCELDAVGKNFWDHPIVSFPVELPPDSPAPSSFPSFTPADNDASIKTYGNKKKVVFYHMGPQVVQNMPAQVIVPKFADSGLSRYLQVLMLDTLRNQIYPTTNTKLGFVLVGLLTCASRGKVGLDTIDPGYLTAQEDVEALADAVGDMLGVVRGVDMKVPVPDFEINPPSREDLVQAVRMSASPFWHFAGSCAVGKVVDADSLKVKGFHNLRVVDASVFPHTVEANTQAATMAVAYLAGELFSE